MTWPNIYRNLKDIDYCVDQFDYVRYDSLGSPWPLSARTVIREKLATNSARCGLEMAETDGIHVCTAIA
jgi:hypothetical protein